MVGLMLEWERHSVSVEQPDVDLGHQGTVSVLPTLEIRPVRLDQVIPYVNSFGQDTAIRISPSNTFAWRLGWGADCKINDRFALNAEWASNEMMAIRPVPAEGMMTRMRLRLAFSSVGRCSSDPHILARTTITSSTHMAGGCSRIGIGLLLKPTLFASTPHQTYLFF